MRSCNPWSFQPSKRSALVQFFRMTTPHCSAAINTFIQQARVNRMLWPANSPDLNPIEHMWDKLCRRVQQHHPPPANLGQLLQWLQQEWNGVPRAFICNMIHSMRQRCVKCLAHNGGHTRY
ncbi:hypothetical protein V1264_013416 [Littorina saxatilis]|uniref:Tc1-like transposase DDE domain-containing protein n=1 Tax=Littorina saxatilis TaxID=31220 RepID=A0AAN9GIJ6_9CAEN